MLGTYIYIICTAKLPPLCLYLQVEELKKAKHACDTLAKQTEVDRTHAQNWRRVADATGRKAKEISQEIAVKVCPTCLINTLCFR